MKFVTKLKIIYIYVSRCIFALILIVMYIYFFNKSIFGEGKANVLGYAPIFVMTESMEPVIPRRSFVIAHTVTADEVDIGDVIAYDHDGITIVHRVIDKTDDGMIFKGDNNKSPDRYPVKDEQILYKILNVE